jgi:hypothetical protein
MNRVEIAFVKIRKKKWGRAEEKSFFVFYPRIRIIYSYDTDSFIG